MEMQFKIYLKSFLLMKTKRLNLMVTYPICVLCNWTRLTFAIFNKSISCWKRNWRKFSTRQHVYLLQIKTYYFDLVHIGTHMDCQMFSKYPYSIFHKLGCMLYCISTVRTVYRLHRTIHPRIKLKLFSFKYLIILWKNKQWVEQKITEKT